MKKFNRLIGTMAAAAALLFTFNACNNSFSDNSPPPQQLQNSGVSYSQEALATPFTLEADVAGAVVTFVNKSLYGPGIVTYKVNGGEAQTIASGSTGTIMLATAGDKVEFFGDNKAYAGDGGYFSNIKCSADCYVYGNIMSLVKSEHFENSIALEKGYTFTMFFENNTHIKNKAGADLLLPAATLTKGCYQGMFSGCTSLTAVPSLPATTLAEECYQSMFAGCTSLKAAPSLPAATLANSCYQYMFSGCASMTAAPELPATTLANSCYDSMFSGCASLKAAPSLPATTLADYCYKNMFVGCASLTAAPSLPAATLAKYCYQSMFAGCASLKAAPSLPAATLAQRCYNSMFSGCTKLSSVTCLATDISSSSCTTKWLDGVADSGTFTKAKDVAWPSGESGIPSGWQVVEK